MIPYISQTEILVQPFLKEENNSSGRRALWFLFEGQVLKASCHHCSVIYQRILKISTDFTNRKLLLLRGFSVLECQPQQ